MPNGAILGPNPQKSVFGAKVAFWTKKCILAPKCISCEKSRFWAKNAFWSKKCPLELSRTHIPLTKIASGRGRCPKSAFWAQKCIFAPKTQIYPGNTHFRKKYFWAKNALCRAHATDACRTNGFLMKFHPFWAKRRFLAQKCTFARKSHF